MPFRRQLHEYSSGTDTPDPSEKGTGHHVWVVTGPLAVAALPVIPNFSLPRAVDTPPRLTKLNLRGIAMPRPEKGGALISLPSGADDFRIGDWWSSLKEAKLFLPFGFAEVMAALDLISVEPLTRLTATACENIKTKTKWTEQFKVRSHWDADSGLIPPPIPI